jgi:hypothetical protein
MMTPSSGDPNRDMDTRIRPGVNIQVHFCEFATVCDINRT